MNSIVKTREDELVNIISDSEKKILTNNNNSIELAMKSGKALIELKEEVASKDQPYWKKWGEYVENHLNFPSYTQSKKYVKLALNKKKLLDEPFSSIDLAVKSLKSPGQKRITKAVEKSSPDIAEKVATGEVTQEEARKATVVTRKKKPEDIVKHHIKSVQKVMPPKFREQPRVAGSLPSFSQVAIKKAEADILTTLNKLESREDSKDVMEAYTAVMSHMDIAMKPVLADVKDTEITKRKKELDKREEDLDKREAALIKGDYVIPSLLNGKGFTGEERKKIRSCLHPDREATHDKKAEAFQIFQKVFN